MTQDEVFNLALQFTLRPDVEGGYANDPLDHGGPTDFGVTQHTYTTWLASKSMPDNNVEKITAQEVRAIYRDGYWYAAKLDQVVAAGGSPQLAIAVFDFGVNTGVQRAAKILQATVGVDTDGVVGHKTINAILAEEHQAVNLVSLYNIRRRNYYKALADQNKADQKFLHGWLNRVDNLEAFLQKEFPQAA